MRALFLLLTLVGPSAAVSQPVTTPAPPHSVIPIVLTPTRPEDGGLYCFGGSPINSWSVDIAGIGWKSPDRSAVEVGSGGATCRRPLWETEVYRLSAFAGTDLGTRQEYYLGNNGVAELDLGLRTSRLSVVWYLTEYVTLSLSVDPLRGRWGLHWSQAPLPLTVVDVIEITMATTNLWMWPRRIWREYQSLLTLREPVEAK